MNKEKYTHIVSSGSTLGKDLIPRIAAVNDSQPITDVLKIEVKK